MQFLDAGPSPAALDINEIVAGQKLTPAEAKVFAEAEAESAKLGKIARRATPKSKAFQEAEAAFWGDPSEETGRAFDWELMRVALADQLHERKKPAIDRESRRINSKLVPLAHRVIDSVSRELTKQAAGLRKKLEAASGLGMAATHAELEKRLERTLSDLAEEKKRAEDGQAWLVLSSYTGDLTMPPVSDADLGGD